MNKKFYIPKLSLKLIGYILISLVTAIFSFAFLYYMSSSIADRFIEKGMASVALTSDPRFLSWLRSVCFCAATVIFFTFFLFFLGQQISYLLSITNAVRMMEGGKLELEINVKGNDELSELADSLNQFSKAFQEHMQHEEFMKKEKQNLVRSLSHDIRTPLTAILSYSDFIQSKRYDTPQKLTEYATIIQEKAYRIKELTDLLLNEEEYPADQEKSLNITLLFAQLIGEFSDALLMEGFLVETSVQFHLDLYAALETSDMIRIFDNLYSNIIKYADKSQPIDIALSFRDSRLMLTQTNAVRPAPRTTPMTSHGIGLDSIRRILQKYNGTIETKLEDNSFQIILLILNL